MTNLPPDMPAMPDPRRILAKMEADVRAFQARADRTNAALANASVEARGEHLTLRMLGAHVTGIDFQDSALGLTPPQLSEEVRRVLLEGSARANHSSAQVIREAYGDESAARGIEDAAPDEVADERERLRAADDVDATPLEQATRPMTSDEAEDLLDDLLNRMDTDDESLDLNDIMRDLDYEHHRSTVPPEQMQAQFEAEMDAIKQHAAQLPQLVETVDGEAENDAVSITVNAAGAIQATRFRAAFNRNGADALNEAFMAAYAAARTDAAQKLSARLTETGLAVPDDARDAFGF